MNDRFGNILNRLTALLLVVVLAPASLSIAGKVNTKEPGEPPEVSPEDCRCEVLNYNHWLDMSKAEDRQQYLNQTVPGGRMVDHVLPHEPDLVKKIHREFHELVQAAKCLKVGFSGTSGAIKLTSGLIGLLVPNSGFVVRQGDNAASYFLDLTLDTATQASIVMFKVFQAMRRQTCTWEEACTQGGFSCCENESERNIKDRIDSAASSFHDQSLGYIYDNESIGTTGDGGGSFF